MNLKDIRDMIGSIVDYDPQVDTYKAEVNRIVNEVIDDFVGMHPWQWSQAELDLYTVPDVNLGTIGFSPAASTAAPVSYIDSTANLLTWRHEGSIMTITGAADDRDNGEYIIDKVDFDSANNRTYVSKLAKPANKMATWHAASNLAQAVVIQRYLPLPYDCSEPLSIGIRNAAESGTSGYRHFYQLTKRLDEELNLRLDIDGYPTDWIPYSHFPEKVLTVADFPAFSSDLTISETPAALGSTPWPQGTYEFKYCYVWRGQEGPLSDAQEFTVVGATSNLQFDTRDTTLAGQYGMRKKIYVRLKAVTSGGVTYSDAHFRDLSGVILDDTNFYVINGLLGTFNIPYIVIDDDLTSFTYPNAVPGLLPTLSYLKSLPRAPDNDGHVWMIRLHPHPAGVTTPVAAIPPALPGPGPGNIGRSASNAFVGLPIRLRYNKRFYVLANDIDTPQMPPDVHRYIVYASCVELFMKHKEKEQALFYTKKTADELSGAQKRWLTTRAGPYVKNTFNVGPIYGEAFRRLTYKP